tara:strand:- start:453 stop:725 length:273 start_codon:yes stop_codon:yes gene_type:complete
MSGINDCTNLVELRTTELREQIKDTYHYLDERMVELDTKNRDHIRQLMTNEVSNVPECPEPNTGKLRMIFIVNIITCIMILIILFKSFTS